MNGGYLTSSDDDAPLKVPSSDEDDNIPLKVIKQPKDPQSYQSLCEHSPIGCDFCDRIFDNRLTAIRHNQNHIIIPLIRQSLIQCPTCLYYFLTWKSFNEHNLNKHEQNRNKNRLQNLIRFEEDIETEALEHEIETIEKNAILNPVIKNDEPIVLSSDDETEEVVQSLSGNSYDSLVEKGSHKCIYCNEVFLTRYMLLTHNLNHIKVHSELHFCKFCENYFETKYQLNIHLSIEHPGRVQDAILHKCRECNLIYNSWVKHHSKYHTLFICYSCKNSKYFKKKKDFVNHMKIHDYKEDFAECDKCGETILVDEMENHEIVEHRPMHVCQICTLFVKSNSMVTYVKVGSHTAEGDKKIPCEKCSNLFINLNVMQKIKMSKPYKTKSKSKTNTDRLKNIQHRLKRLKELNRY